VIHLRDSSQSTNLPLAWGTGSSFGQIASEKQALTLIDACLDSGIRRFDTGASYAMGNSEKLLGSCLRQSGIERSSLVLSTKIGSIPSSSIWQKTSKDYGAPATKRLLLSSLANLQTDYIDIIFFHSLPKNESDIAGAMDVLSEFKRSGQIRKIGVSAHSIEELEWIKSNPKPFDILMTHFNPLAFEETGSCLTRLKQAGIFVYGSAPFSSGLLIRKRDLINAGKPCNSLFKLLRYAQRSRKLPREKSALIKKIKRQIDSGALDLLDYSLTSELVDVTVIGSLSAKNIEVYCRRALALSGDKCC
jgi:aryl-alcohol dehydrogenase-like predicted oxidoreductase